MIELKPEKMQNAIAKAKTERKNLVVRLTEAVRMYRVESRTSGNTYTVNFFIRGNRRFGHCTCKAGLDGRHACKHIAAAAALNMSLAERGLLNRKAVSAVG